MILGGPLPQTVLARYEALVASGELKPDAEQASAAARLDELQRELETAPQRSGFFARLTGKKAEAPRGLYLWGSVGRGKSMLMDLFHSCLSIPKKRRVHFHEFMIEIHARLRVERQKEMGDPILPVVEAIAAETSCLCFDEMVVNNSADAMIMSRLFAGLIDAGVVLVTTSNRAPSELYKDGLNREHFLPFIALIEHRLDVISLNGPTDYRMERLAGVATWHSPLGDAATEACRDAFFRLTDFSPDDAEHVPAEDIDLGGGRILRAPKSLKGVAVFSFKRLCAEARGASDYLAIARRYHSVIIVGIPQMSRENRNEAARFVTLIDALYEQKVKLIAAAAAVPAELYPEGDGRFEFERTISRLMEMQSQDYLALGHGDG
jgi:cell division protein ZapE